MRCTFNPQLELGASPLEGITFNLRSRDDIPQILTGLQYIYTTPRVRDEIFTLLANQIAPDVDFETGRPGMDLWILLVLGCLRLGLNCDYDRLHELANEHKTIRAMLGHGTFSEHLYALQTLKDNVMLLTPTLLENINTIVVKAGHELVKKKEGESLKGRCDSFVVETHVEYPTDVGLLADAMRVIIRLTARCCRRYGLPGWRQEQSALIRLKKLKRNAQQAKRSRKVDAERSVQRAHARYIKVAQGYLARSVTSCETLKTEVAKTLEPEAYVSLQRTIDDIQDVQAHAVRQIDQIRQRVLEGETIPSKAKVYSIFQPHTDWICKGKAGVPFELGLRVCLIEDQYQFILHQHVMEKEQDVEVALPMVEATQKVFPDLTVCSFDKGFHSLENQKALAERLELVALPKKGKRSLLELEKEQATEFRQARRQHSAVESAINALEQHGLDRCPDHGIDGFKRYVALSVLAHNLQRLGAIVTEKARAKAKRKRPDKLAA